MHLKAFLAVGLFLACFASHAESKKDEPESGSLPIYRWWHHKPPGDEPHRSFDGRFPRRRDAKLEDKVDTEAREDMAADLSDEDKLDVLYKALREKDPRRGRFSGGSRNEYMMNKCFQEYRQCSSRI